MDILKEIIAYKNKKISDNELYYLLDLLGQLKKTRAKKEAIRVLYSTVDLNANQYQSIVDHSSVRKVQDLLRFAQKKARHNTYRSTQKILVENEKMSLSQALGLALLMIFLAALAALLVPQLSELFL